MWSVPSVSFPHERLRVHVGGSHDDAEDLLQRALRCQRLNLKTEEEVMPTPSQANDILLAWPVCSRRQHAQLRAHDRLVELHQRLAHDVNKSCTMQTCSQIYIYIYIYIYTDCRLNSI